MDNDANVGRDRRGGLRRGRGLRPVVLHDAFDRHRRRHLVGRRRSGAAPIPTPARSATSRIRPDGPECLCGARGCFERMCSRTVAGARPRPAGEGTDARSGVRPALCGGSRAGAEGVYHVIESRADRDRRRASAKPATRCSCPLRAELRPPDHGVVAAPRSTWCRRNWATTACFMALWRWREHGNQHDLSRELQDGPAEDDRDDRPGQSEPGDRVVQRGARRRTNTSSSAATAAALPRPRISRATS